MSAEMRPGIIYLAVNRVNQKAYVGQTHMTLRQRMMRHFTNNKRRSIFCLALKEYGLDSFDCAVLESCDSRTKLNEREEHWIAVMGSQQPHGYNVSSGLGMKGATQTPEGIKKLSDLRKQNWQDPEYRKKRIGGHWTKSPRAQEIRAALSASAAKQHTDGILGSHVIKKSWDKRKQRASQ